MIVNSLTLRVMRLVMESIKIEFPRSSSRALESLRNIPRAIWMKPNVEVGNIFIIMMIICVAIRSLWVVHWKHIYSLWRLTGWGLKIIL